MKKFFAVIAALVCALSLTACDLFGGGGNSNNNDREPVDERFCTVTFVTNCDENFEPQECYKGDPINLPEFLRDGEDVTFDGWYESSDFSGAKYTDTYTPTKNVTLYAKFLKHTFPLYKEEAEEANCDMPGNVEYYVCGGCGEFFADADAKTPLNEADLEKPATGNHPYSEEFSHNGATHRRYATCSWDYLYVDLGLHDTLGENGVCSVCGAATAGVTENLKFELNYEETGYKVTGIDGDLNTDTLRIPAEYDGKPVVEIGYYAFQDSSNSKMKAVVLPSSIKKIGNSAFKDLAMKGDVIFEGTIEQWCNIEFASDSPYGTHTLIVDGEEVKGDIVVPDSVTEMSWQFYGINDITSLTFGGNIKKIREFVNYSVPKINYTGTVADWLDIDFSRNANPLNEDNELYIGGKLVTEITVPQGVTEIKDYAFYEYGKLTKINLSGTVTSIGYNSFWRCYELVSVSGFANVKSVGASAFAYCENLVQIDDASSLLEVERNAFFGCFEKVAEQEDGIFYLGKCAIATKGLTNKVISLRANTVSFAESLFSGSDIKEVTIPASLRYMGSSVFENCGELEKVTFEVGVREISYRAFFGCSSLATLELGEIEKIGRAAFYNCSSLEEFTLPTTCISIGDESFKSCSALKKVHYIGTEALWANVQVGSGNDLLSNAILYEPPQD